MKNFFENLISEITKLPGIGEKTAERIVLYMLKRDEKENESLAMYIKDLKKIIKSCSICGNFSEKEICNICSDPERDRKKICVVEEARYIRILEKTELFKGLYHVLGGVISPIHGIGPEQLKVKELIERVQKENTEEIILALNQTTEAELTGLYLAKILKSYNVTITRLLSGIPVGTDLEFVDIMTLSRSIEGRQKISN